MSKPVMQALLVKFLACCSIFALSPQGAHSEDMHARPGSHARTLAVNGLQRTYIVHVPVGTKPPSRMPVVVMLHGGGGTAKAAMWETGWAMKADREGFIAVFPDAMARDPARPSRFSTNPQLWNDGSGRFYPGQTRVDDIAFLAAMLDDLALRFAVDERRIFLTGFSNGASLSFRAGAELSNRIAAIAPVAGALWLDSLSLRHPVSMLYITGTEDPLNLIDGGPPRLASGASDSVRAKPKPPVRDSILKWAMALRCPALASRSSVHGVSRETFSPCMEDAQVVYITVDGMGHTWAGGRSLLPERMVGKSSNSISATDVIWEFFRKHAKPLPADRDVPAVAPASASTPRH